MILWEVTVDRAIPPLLAILKGHHMAQDQIYQVWALVSVQIPGQSPEDAMAQMNDPGRARNSIRHLAGEVRVLCVGDAPIVTHSNVTVVDVPTPAGIIPPSFPGGVQPILTRATASFGDNTGVEGSA